jgi:hypothetical protein
MFIVCRRSTAEQSGAAAALWFALPLQLDTLCLVCCTASVLYCLHVQASAGRLMYDCLASSVFDFRGLAQQ